MSGRLAEGLRACAAAGRKAFVAYVTAGLPEVDPSFLRELARAGADAIEVGIPFSDPVMDGPVIQEASRRSLEAGTTPAMAFDLVRQAALDVPVVVMTYTNPVIARGIERFAREAGASGVGGAIVPDLPIDEAGEWIGACRGANLATVFLAAPNCGTERLRLIVHASQGFVYCVSTYGVTGARNRLAGSAADVVAALRPLTDLPLLVGVGISSPEQANEGCRFADGVVVGTALVRPLLEGRPHVSLELARAFREACSGF